MIASRGTNASVSDEDISHSISCGVGAGLFVLCDASACVGFHERGRAEDAANEQLALLTGRMEQVLSGMKTALDELAEDRRILPALSKQDRVQPRELYAALVEQAVAMPEVSQLMLVDESGTCLCALRGQGRRCAQGHGLGSLANGAGRAGRVYSELGRIAAVRRAQTGYLLAEISGMTSASCSATG